MKTDESTLHDVHTTWIDAINAGHVDPLLAMMTDDVVLMGPGMPAIGKDKFSEVFEGGHKDALLRCVSELQEVILTGDLACTRSRDTVTVTPRTGGATVTLAGDRLTIYRKVEGRWLLARDAHTLAPVDG